MESFRSVPFAVLIMLLQIIICFQIYNISMCCKFNVSILSVYFKKIWTGSMLVAIWLLFLCHRLTYTFSVMCTGQYTKEFLAHSVTGCTWGMQMVTLSLPFMTFLWEPTMEVRHKLIRLWTTVNKFCTWS